MRPIHVVVGVPSLAATLAQVLADATGRAVGIHPVVGNSPAPAVLVAATSECSPDECFGLKQDNRDVIILAAVPSPFQEQAYLKAGAAGYLPMSIDVGPLVELLRALL